MISPLIYEAAVMWTGTYLVFFLIMAALCISNLYMVPSLTLPIFITQCWQETTGREWETTSYWRHGVAPSTRHLLFCTCALSGWPFARNIRPTSRYGGQTYKRLVLSSEETWNTREREREHESITAPGWVEAISKLILFVLFNSFPLHFMNKRCDRWHQSIRNGSKWCEVLTGVALRLVSKMLHKAVELWSKLETLRISEMWN